MKKLFVYSTLLLALGACKSNSSDTKKDDKSSSSTSTSSGTSTPMNETNSSTSSSSSGGGSWSSADKNMFMTTCTDAAAKSMGVGKAKDYCSCMLDKIEVAYPNSNDAGKMTANETTEMAKECLK